MCHNVPHITIKSNIKVCLNTALVMVTIATNDFLSIKPMIQNYSLNTVRNREKHSTNSAIKRIILCL